MKYLYPTLLFLLPHLIWGQSDFIRLDGKFDDWQGQIAIEDPAGDASQLDLRSVTMSHDEQFFYLRLVFTDEIPFQESDLELFLDTDLNSSTGSDVSGIGADFVYHFGQKEGSFQGMTVRQWALGLIALPTHTSDTFEIAIRRDARPDGQNLLFSTNSVRLVLRTQGTSGDLLPDQSFLTYDFVPTTLPVYTPIDLAKSDSSLLRLVSYNVLSDGPFDPGRRAPFPRIWQAMGADIYCFNEFYNSSANQVKTLMDQVLPLGTAQGWYVKKEDADNVTVSRWPILDAVKFSTYGNMTANWIDLPNTYLHDLVVINAHFSCCTANDARQRQADAVVAFFRDLKNGNGPWNLPNGTPLVLAGDLNLVGFKQQLLTLLEGDIQDEGLFGPDAAPDWDGSSLTDVIIYQSDAPIATTWRNPNSVFAPGRLDYIIYSDHVMTVRKAWSLDTPTLPGNRLSQYQLQLDDTYVSDHLPLVVDFELAQQATHVAKPASPPFDIYLPQGQRVLRVTQTHPVTDLSLKLIDAQGKVVQSWQLRKLETHLDLAHLPIGVYLVIGQNELGEQLMTRIRLH